MAKPKWREKATKPAAGVPAATKTRVAKLARAGKKVGKGRFEEVARKAATRYGSEERGRRVAAAQMWKMVKAGKLPRKGGTSDSWSPGTKRYLEYEW